MKNLRNSKSKEYNGVIYKSKLEASFAKILDEYSIPFEYETKKFLLVPTIRYDKETLVSCSYTPDFILPDNVIIEAKGFPDSKWYLRKRLFIKKYILDNDFEWEFHEVHTVSKLKEFLTEYKKRGMKRIPIDDINIGKGKNKKKKKK